MSVRMQDVKKMVGKTVYGVKKDGTRVSGKLVCIKGNRLYLKPAKAQATTSAIAPLALFDLLAIGTSPFAFGAFPFGFGFGGFPFFI